jgi:hypothetical protein
LDEGKSIILIDTAMINELKRREEENKKKKVKVDEKEGYEKIDGSWR